MYRISTLFVVILLLVGMAACTGPKTNQAPVNENGEPILADIAGGKFQITLPYFEAAFGRVPIANRAQYEGLEGKREFLQKAVIETVFYLEGIRRKVVKKKEFRKALRRHLYGAVNEIAREKLLEGIEIPETTVREEYDRIVKDKEKFPYEKMAGEIRHRLLGRALDEAYAAKKVELAKEWNLKINHDLLGENNPFKAKGQKEWPKLDEAVATGDDYQYTVGNMLMRIDETPPETRRKLRDHPNPKKLLEFLIGEDLIHNWVKKNGWDTGPTWEARKKVVEVGTLSAVTRDEIVGKDIKATFTDARKFYEANAKDIFYGADPPPFEAVKDQMIERQTQQMRDDATRSLAQSLMAHRYKTVFFEPNIKQYLK